jgi:hypothetical protein
MEFVLDALRVMTLRMGHASSVPPTMPSHQTMDAVNGIGIIKFAFNALMDGPLMPTKSAPL